MSDALELSAQLCESAASELERAAQHCRTAAGHFRHQEVPRATAHSWAAFGHVLAAQESLQNQARDHAAKAVP